MTSHGPKRYLVVLGARTPRKSESVYYNLQVWLFLRHFWTFSGLVIFSPKTFLRVSTWLVTVRCAWHHLHCLEKPLNTPFFRISWNLKLTRNEHKGIHIFVPSHMTSFQWPTMFLVVIPWGSELGLRESPKACIITFNFGCFWDIFDFSGPDHIFSWNVLRKDDVICNVARVLGTIWIVS